MAPAKPRGNAEDAHGPGTNSRGETNSSKDRNGHHTNHGHTNGVGHHPATNGKARRTAATSNASVSAAAAAAAATAHQQQLAQQVNGALTSDAASALAAASNPTIQWNDFERNFLHAYRRAYDLNTSASFSNDYHRWVLSQPGSIGLRSPTMMRQQKLRRQSKDQLAAAARKHFNGQGVQENDIIVDFLHKVQNHEVPRLHRPRRMGSNAREADG